MNALSLFANVGVAETYLSEIELDVVVANELEPDRAKFYSHLYPNCDMVCGDITETEVFEKIITKAKKMNVEFVIANFTIYTADCAGNSGNCLYPNKMIVTDKESFIKVTITSTPCSNAGCFFVHRKFTEQNRAGIEFLQIVCYNKLSYLC